MLRIRTGLNDKRTGAITDDQFAEIVVVAIEQLHGEMSNCKQMSDSAAAGLSQLQGMFGDLMKQVSENGNQTNQTAGTTMSTMHNAHVC